MADPAGPRCTRRKQANPRRKNVELEDMPEEVDLDHLGPSDSGAKESGAEDGDGDDPACGEGEANNNNNNGASKDDLRTPSETVVGDKCNEDVDVHSSSSSPPPPHHPRPSDSSSDDRHPSQAPPPPLPPPPTVKEALSPAAAVPNGCRQEEDLKSEEEKIQEYLRRSDTAVIFPEPVDGEGDTQPSSVDTKAATICNSQDSYETKTAEEFYLKCPHCDKACSSIDTLRSHLVSQHGASEPLPDNVFACDKCSATFVQKELLEKHETLHSPAAQVVACRVCNKTFANVYRLQRHMISHDESAVLRKFKCPECEKAFKFKHHLKEHIRIHSGEKPFVCPNCGKRFSHSGSYSSHMTSKKCLVMNLKVRRTVDKPLRTNSNNSGGCIGGMHPSGRRSNPQGSFPPILPKYGENGLELSPPYAGGLATTGLSPEHFALDFSHPSLQAFLPPYPTLSYPLLASSHYHNSGLNSYSLAPSLPNLSHMIRPSAISAKSVEECRLPSPIPGRTSTSPRCDSESRIPLLSCDAGSPCSLSNANSCGDLNAVKKILATVNATVRQQQEVGKLKNGLLHDEEPPRLDSPNGVQPRNSPSLDSPLSSSRPTPSNAILLSVDLKKNGFKADDSHCRYCGDNFVSKIELHQHERYLCKLNKDIQTSRTGDVSMDTSDEPPPPLTSSRSRSEGSSYGTAEIVNVSNGYSEPDDEGISDDTDSVRDASDDALLTSDGRKVRMRSLISEEHLAVLRHHYENNPKPNKEDVHRIATAIKFPHRVVQVWFQNMRARDKKRGRTFQEVYLAPAAENMPSTTITPPPSYPVKAFPAITPTSYAPGVTPFNGMLSPRHPVNVFCSPMTPPISYPLPTPPIRMNGNCSSPGLYPTSYSADHEQPLDLSFKSKLRSAFHSPELGEEDCEVLNLSQKSSRTSTPSKESNNHITANAVVSQLHTSSYSQALLPHHHFLTNSFVSNNGAAFIVNHHNNSHHLFGKVPSPKSDCKVESSSLLKSLKRECPILSRASEMSPIIIPSALALNSTRSHEEHELAMESSSEMDRRPLSSPTSPPPLEVPRLQQILSAAASPGSEVTGNGTVDSSGQVYSTDGSHSPCPSDRDENLEIDEVLTPHKRFCKQPGEESPLDIDDSSVGEDDRPLKQRKSWKQHKLDSEDYSCDQCDKTFSKQSSLARHKYEHSGQRPHKCDVCNKAFKHKHHLTEHKRLHSGEKPFQCKKCLKRFSHSGSYSQHMNHRYSYCKPYRE